MSTGKEINNLKGISDNDIGKMAGVPMEKQKQKEPLRERLSELKRQFTRLELLIFIPVLYIFDIIFKKYLNKDIKNIIGILSLIICELYMFLKIDFTSIESIIFGLVMGLIQAFIITSGTIYLLYISKNLSYKK